MQNTHLMGRLSTNESKLMRFIFLMGRTVVLQICPLNEMHYEDYFLFPFPS